ncbi:uncharacterized protein BDV14DRAFT_91754 [Aspergillus stella-maris]|uniref:uncharacterized protein n=1 Tax=Aspergillus stella-maris TaxID=1810926 RepID=UPI003CCE0C7B
MMQTVASRPPNPFNQNHKTRNQRMTTGLPKLEDDCDFIGLLDFEDWVENELQRWHAANTNPTDKAHSDIAVLMNSYLNIPSKTYDKMPDGMSRMFLVVLELWVCYDSICITLCPLFGNFSPGIPKKFLQPLLLPQHCQVRRAQAVEDCIRQRHQNKQKGRSVFNDPGPDTFAVQYFDCSVRQRKLQDEIIRSATQERDSRSKLWEGLSAKYQYLVSQSSNLVHDSDYNEWNENWRTEHAICRLKSTRGRFILTMPWLKM